jgi:hypothetical protein
MKSLPAPRLRHAAACVIALALAGCSNASPSVVAYVGDSELTQTEVEQAIAGIRATLGEGQVVSSEAVLNAMIEGELAAQIAADRDSPSPTPSGTLCWLKASWLPWSAFRRPRSWSTTWPTPSSSRGRSAPRTTWPS